jgi:hypothetical protein
VTAGASAIAILPPPLWGRVGERGKPHSEVGKVQLLTDNNVNHMRSQLLATNLASAQVAPLSLTLPHNGGGNALVDGVS